MAALDNAAEMLADRLMAEADAEQRAPRVGAGGDEVEADARVIGRAGAGRDQDRIGAGAKGLCRGERVVAFDAHLGAQLDQIMNEVEGERSEEHTSEHQSLMRLSYAVFCLKKKKNATHSHMVGDHHR